MTTNQTKKLLGELRLSQGWIAEEGFFTRWGWNLGITAPDGVQTPRLETVPRYPLFMAVCVLRSYFLSQTLTPPGKAEDWDAVVRSLDDVERHIQQVRGWHYSTTAEVLREVRGILERAPSREPLEIWLDCPGILSEDHTNG